MREGHLLLKGSPSETSPTTRDGQWPSEGILMPAPGIVCEMRAWNKEQNRYNQIRTGFSIGALWRDRALFASGAELPYDSPLPIRIVSPMAERSSNSA